GFALLLVLLMGAVIAITLYMEIPRIAFDSQRQKEQLLIERGEQYKRAIQLFVSASNRWPARIEELESFNNRHYLRKRFRDPITGKDEWRFVHIQNGVLTDSVTTKQNAAKEQSASAQGQYVGVQAGIGETPINSGGQQGGVNLAMRQRASDRGPGGMGQELPSELRPGSGPPQDPNHPVGAQPLPGQLPQFPGQSQPPIVNPPNMPIQVTPGAIVGIPGQINNQGQPGFGTPGQNLQPFLGGRAGQVPIMPGGFQ